MASSHIMFAGENIRLILDNNKTQTRRALQPQPRSVPGTLLAGQTQWNKLFTWKARGGVDINWGIGDQPPRSIMDYCPYGQPGDKLWVKESWGITSKISTDTHKELISDRVWVPNWMAYKADQPEGNWEWKSPMFMPDSFVRLVLRIKYIGIQQLRDMTHLEAKAEGARMMGNNGNYLCDYERMWNSVNKTKANRFNFKTWVWVIGFEVIRKGLSY